MTGIRPADPRRPPLRPPEPPLWSDSSNPGASLPVYSGYSGYMLEVTGLHKCYGDKSMACRYLEHGPVSGAPLGINALQDVPLISISRPDRVWRRAVLDWRIAD